MTFRITGAAHYLSGGEYFDDPQQDDNLIIDFPMPAIVQNGAVKLVVTQPPGQTENASLIAAIARGTCWFDDLTSGKASSISEIAKRENVTESYVSRLLNLALLKPTLVHQVLAGHPATIIKYELTGQRRSTLLWGKQGQVQNW